MRENINPVTVRDEQLAAICRFVRLWLAENKAVERVGLIPWFA